MKTALFFLSLCFSAQAEPWIEASNRVAESYARADGELYPERASAAGLREFDAKAFSPATDQNFRELAFLREWEAKLRGEVAQAREPNLRLDLTILRDHLRLRREELELNEQFGVVAFLPGTRFVLESLLALSNEQAPAARKAAAVARFHLYVNGEGTMPPLLTAFKNRELAEEIHFLRKQLMPTQAEVAQYLAESPAYVSGVEQALRKAAAPGWESDFALFRDQANAYDEFVRSHVLPLARADFRLPRALYGHSLRVRGIEERPEDLIRSARAEYKRLTGQFHALGRLVAKQEGLSDTLSPAEVITALKRHKVVKPPEVKALFEDADRTLEVILRDHGLVTLPAAPLRIRVAGDAESLANPIPHLTEPPLVGNTGERPELVVPAFSSGASAPLDDFSYRAAALVLTAHEGRPGHDLQFSSMLDHGTSIIRARYAFNNANVEGWGLYAEEMVYPYLPPTAQLAALQFRLLRVARAFLDPELQLGRTNPRAAGEFLIHELGVSDRLAALEVHRFTFDNPGQAPSYFYGLQRMEGAHRELAHSLGKNFSDHCFHDGVLSLGMVPVGLIGSQLEKNLKCGKATAARGALTPAVN